MDVLPDQPDQDEGVPAGELSDDDLLRELEQLHRTRHETFLHAPTQALQHHSERTATLELEYTSGRYFTLIYSGAGTVQWERGYPSLPEAARAYERLLAAVADGRVDPAQPVSLQA